MKEEVGDQEETCSAHPEGGGNDRRQIMIICSSEYSVGNPAPSEWRQ